MVLAHRKCFNGGYAFLLLGRNCLVLARKISLFFSFPALLRYSWLEHCEGLRCTTGWFDTHISCKITTTKNVYTSITSHSYFWWVCVVRIFKIYSLSKFQVYNTIFLTKVPIPYIRSLALTAGSLYPLTIISPTPPSPRTITILLPVLMSSTSFRFHM